MSEDDIGEIRDELKAYKDQIDSLREDLKYVKGEITDIKKDIKNLVLLALFISKFGFKVLK